MKFTLYTIFCKKLLHNIRRPAKSSRRLQVGETGAGPHRSGAEARLSHAARAGRRAGGGLLQTLRAPRRTRATRSGAQIRGL